MIYLILYLTIFLFSFYILLKSADFFIDEAGNLGKLYGMSKFMIGIIIVAIGTSLPEMITSLGSFFFSENPSDFVIGTAMGSNITNILLAFGLFLVYAGTFTIKKKEVFNAFALLFTTILFSLFVIMGFVNYFAISFIIFYFIYLYYLFKNQKKEIEQQEEEFLDDKVHSEFKSYITLFLSLLGLFVGAKLAIFSVENIGKILLIPTAYLTLTTISIATSLPEIAVTISSAKKKQYLIGIGNILGTNIMNTCLIIGLSGFAGYYFIETKLYLISIMLFLISTLIFAWMIYKQKFYKEIGSLFLILYVFYLGSFFIF